MNSKSKSGLSLIETVIVVAIVAVIISIGTISVKALKFSLLGSGSTSTINGLLSSARSIAVAERKYTGVRFQKQSGKQYAVLITHNRNIPYPNDGKTIPFMALANHKPVNLGQDDNSEQTTIVFSPQGKLTRKWVQIFSNPDMTNDDMFGADGLFPEDTASKLSDNLLAVGQKKFYVSPYVGTLIESD